MYRLQKLISRRTCRLIGYSKLKELEVGPSESDTQPTQGILLAQRLSEYNLGQAFVKTCRGI